MSKDAVSIDAMSIDATSIDATSIDAVSIDVVSIDAEMSICLLLARKLDGNTMYSLHRS